MIFPTRLPAEVSAYLRDDSVLLALNEGLLSSELNIVDMQEANDQLQL